MKSSNHEMTSRGEAFGLWRLWQTRKLVQSSGITLYFHSSFRNADCGTIYRGREPEKLARENAGRIAPLPVTPAP
ncbi:hypothetical protein GBA52_023948 [Prunus armeniaca]|nr:hypothetical protein GBA52_023948 [Prunus armeniaca]